MKSLKSRLIFSIIIVLSLSQIVSATWLWFEADEQIAILTRTDLTHHQTKEQILEEKWESFFAVLLPALVCIIASITILSFKVDRLTAPLEKLAKHIDSLTLKDLSPITDIPHSSIEIQTIIESTNRLLHRIELGIDNERAFTSNVAHELRTPLAGIRMHLELLQEQHPQAITPLINRIDDLVELSALLLQLARTYQQSLASTFQLDTIDLVADLCSPLQEQYADNVQWHFPDNAKCQGNAILLQAALRNLIENANKYADQHTPIQVSLTASHQAWVLQVSNKRFNLDNTQLSDLTRRFFRADQSKQGYGVGLSIVQRIADLHHAALEFNHLDNVFEVKLHLPLS